MLWLKLKHMFYYIKVSTELLKELNQKFYSQQFIFWLQLCKNFPSTYDILR